MERFSGPKLKRNDIISDLANLRTEQSALGFLATNFPGVTFERFSNLITNPRFATIVDQEALSLAGHDLKLFLGKLGVSTTLNEDRVFIPMTSASADCFGGFHEPNQGYRYVQSLSIVSLLGFFSNEIGSSLTPHAVSIDLIRSYVHDSLHHATFRLFQARKNSSRVGDGLSFFRAQYGINFRSQDKGPYSQADSANSYQTRNLGIIMEGCTDRIAQDFAAAYFRESSMADCPTSPLLKESTGRFCFQDTPARMSTNNYLGRMLSFFSGVTVRYRNFIDELARFDNREDFHNLILKAMLSGNLRELSLTLNSLATRTNAFSGLFRRKSE